MTTVQAPAKINLVLEILGVLPQGFHNIDTIYQQLELCDTLYACQAEVTSLSMVDNVGSGLDIECDERNLVIQALRQLEQYAGRSLPTKFELTKRIPAGGGLGGGSADAAAALKAVVHEHHLEISHENLMKIAGTLGADVAFGLVGGTARGRDRGQLLEKLPPLPQQDIILVIPNSGLSTPSVYAAWDKLPTSQAYVSRGQAEQLYGELKTIAEAGRTDSHNQARILKCLSNDLEPAAIIMLPRLSEIRRKMLQAGCQKAMLCGSGSTVFGIPDPDVSISTLSDKLSPLGLTVSTKTSDIICQAQDC